MYLLHFKEVRVGNLDTSGRSFPLKIKNGDRLYPEALTVVIKVVKVPHSATVSF